jgi:hypothetical protein
LEFFDKKEEVIDIQLTQYGKHLLSLGKFKPTQYAFFDGDIIYDVKYASGSEKQSEAERRIKDTPRLKTQYVYSGIETEITKINKLVKGGDLYGDTNTGLAGIQLGTIGNVESIFGSAKTGFKTGKLAETYRGGMSIVDWAHGGQPAAEKNYSLTLPLGQSSLSSQYYPAWDIKFLHSSASVDDNGISFTNELTGKNFKSVKIPQGEIEIRYKTYVTYVDEFGEVIKNYLQDDNQGTRTDDFYADMSVFPDVYGNNSTLQVQPDYLLLDILEKNVDYETKNFDIEVFTVDDNGNEEQLFFMKDNETKTEQHVEWWFNVYTDEEIDQFIFCKSQKQHKSKDLFADQHKLFKCPDIEEEIPFENIYEVTITDEEDPC